MKVELRHVIKRNHLYKVKLTEFRDLMAKKENRTHEESESDLSSFVSMETPGLLAQTATEYCFEMVCDYLAKQMPHEYRDINHNTKTMVYPAN